MHDGRWFFAAELGLDNRLRLYFDVDTLLAVVNQSLISNHPAGDMDQSELRTARLRCVAQQRGDCLGMAPFWLFQLSYSNAELPHRRIE